MKDNCFIDTNVLIYSHSDIDQKKQDVARSVINTDNVYISTQVLNEFISAFSRKFKTDWDTVIQITNEARENLLVHISDTSTIDMACQIAKKYQYSYYDSQIIAAALQCGCKILYSEDMQDRQVIENSLKIVNPFK
jgi:predicted nucleic acid-binding protein